jgi:hypothetical protein
MTPLQAPTGRSILSQNYLLVPIFVVGLPSLVIRSGCLHDEYNVLRPGEIKSQQENNLHKSRQSGIVPQAYGIFPELNLTSLSHRI